MAGYMQVEYTSAYIQVISILLLLRNTITAFIPTPEVKASFNSLDQCWAAPPVPSHMQAGSQPRSHWWLCWAVLGCAGAPMQELPPRSIPAGNLEEAMPYGEEPARTRAGEARNAGWAEEG